MNTFGDEIFGDPQVLKSYYYAISDFSVGGMYAFVKHLLKQYNNWSNA